MNSCIQRLAVSAALVCVCASRAGAQPPVVQSAMQPDDVQLHEEQRLEEKHDDKPWSVNFSASRGFESNVTGAPSGPSDSATYLTGAGSRRFTLSRGQITLSGDVGQNLYTGTDAPSNLSYGGAAVGTWALTPRLVWTAGESASAGYAQDATQLPNSGLLPPKLITYLNTISTGFDYELSARGRLHWAIAQQNTSFSQSQVTNGTTTPVPSSLTTAMNIGRQLSGTQTLGVSVDFQHAVTNGDSASQGGILGNWQRAFGRNWSVFGSGGVRLYTVPGEAGIQAAPGGSAGVVVRARHNDTFSATYDRSTTIEQAGGALTHLGDSIGASYGSHIGRVGINASVYYARSYFPLDPSHKRYGDTENVSAQYLVVKGLDVGVDYGYYHRVDTPTPQISGYTARLFLSYGLHF
jgi:hypothetical protein